MFFFIYYVVRSGKINVLKRVLEGCWVRFIVSACGTEDEAESAWDETQPELTSS